MPADARVAYLASARLPTEKAHGVQIMKSCEALARAGVDVTLYHPAREQPDPKLRGVDPFEHYGVPRTFELRTIPFRDILVHEPRVPRPLFAAAYVLHRFAWARKVGAQARKAGASVYLTRDIETAEWLTRHGLPTVWEAHAAPQRLQARLLQRMAPRASLRLVVALTDQLRGRLAEAGVSERRLHVAHDAVDTRAFERVPDRAACRAAITVPTRGPVVGYIGRFQTMGVDKGLGVLVQAMAHVSPAARLLAVGGPLSSLPPYEEQARAAGIARERLDIRDRVEHPLVPTYIRACDVVCIPSPWSEFAAYHSSPMKLFEYMASGVPIVASDLPALREVLRHEENALLVPPGDPRALGAAVTRLLDDKALGDRLAGQARKEVSTRTWDARAHDILARLDIKPPRTP